MSTLAAPVPWAPLQLARAVADGSVLSIGSVPQLLDAAAAAGRAGMPARVRLQVEAGSALVAIATRLADVGRIEVCEIRAG